MASSSVLSLSDPRRRPQGSRASAAHAFPLHPVLMSRGSAVNHPI